MKRLGGVKRPWLPGDDSGGESEGQDALTTHGFGIGNADYDSAEFVAGAPPPQQQQPSGGEALPADNVGRVIAERLGYVAGRGLGRREDGRLAPVEAVQRTRRAGLGVDEVRLAACRASAFLRVLTNLGCPRVPRRLGSCVGAPRGDVRGLPRAKQCGASEARASPSPRFRSFRAREARPRRRRVWRRGAAAAERRRRRRAAGRRTPRTACTDVQVRSAWLPDACIGSCPRSRMGWS